MIVPYHTGLRKAFSAAASTQLRRYSMMSASIPLRTVSYCSMAMVSDSYSASAMAISTSEAPAMPIVEGVKRPLFFPARMHRRVSSSGHLTQPAQYRDGGCT